MGREHIGKIEYCADSTGLNIVWRRFLCSCGDHSDWEIDECHTVEDIVFLNSAN